MIIYSGQVWGNTILNIILPLDSRNVDDDIGIRATGMDRTKEYAVFNILIMMKKTRSREFVDSVWCMCVCKYIERKRDT